MNLSELQADLRHFAAERDWQPFHTPKNLSTALMVEAAAMRPDVNFAMVEMHMDGLTPPLELVEAGVWRVNLKLPMAGLWIVNVGFGEEFAEIQFDAP